MFTLILLIFTFEAEIPSCSLWKYNSSNKPGFSYQFAVTNASDCFLGVVFGDCCLMYKDVFLGVITVDETVTGFYVKPFDGTADFGGDHFFRSFVGLCLLCGGLFSVG